MKDTQIKNMFKEIKNKHICKIRKDFKDQTKNEVHYDMKALEEEIFKKDCKNIGNKIELGKLFDLFLWFRNQLEREYFASVMIDYHVDKLEFKGGLAVVPITSTTYIRKYENIELDNVINGLSYGGYWNNWS